MLLFFAVSCSSQEPLQGEVIRVTDGDTVIIEVDKLKKKMTCRLYGIDSPENPRKNRKGQPYSSKAGQELKRLVHGQDVEIVTTGEKTHGRDVCIITKEGMDVNLEMVKRGYAWAYRKHLKSPYASEYISAENKARSQGLGLWQDSNPLPPWEFKRRHWNK